MVFRKRKNERKDVHSSPGQSLLIDRASEFNQHISYPDVILSCGSDSIHVITSLPAIGLFATFGHDGIIRVYSPDTADFSGAVYRTCDTQNKIFMSLILLYDGVLAFIGADGNIFTWNANTGVVLSELTAGNAHFSVIAKLNSTQIVVGTVEGEVLIVSHTNGHNLRFKATLGNLHAKTVKDIAVKNGDIIVTGGIDGKAVVYSTKTREKLASFRNGDWVLRVVMSPNYVVTCVEDSTMYIQDSTTFATHSTVDFDQILPGESGTIQVADDNKDSIWIMDLMFLTSDLLMLTTLKHGVLFYSIDGAKCISKLNPGTRTGLRSATILSDGRVCAGGYSGYCGIFKAPEVVSDSVSQYVELQKYPILSLLSTASPLKSLWHEIHDNDDVLTLEAASEVLSVTAFCAVKSLEEWTYGHYLLMTLVRRKVIPSGRSYRGSEIFWWDRLYVRASTYEMSSEDLNLVLKFIIEAENTGIIGAGCAEMFKETRNLRQELTVATTRLGGMLLELFCTQIATDTSIRELFHYQKIQTAVQFFSAVLSCIPFAGGVIAHLLSGGSSVFTHVPGEGLSVAGLVESLVGIGKDWSTLISEPVIQRVLQVTNRILHKDTWVKLPERNRTAIQDAAVELNLSVGDLRDKVARYHPTGHAAEHEHGNRKAIGIARVEEDEELNARIHISQDSYSARTHPNAFEQLTKELRELKWEIQRMKKEKQVDANETRRVLEEMKQTIEELRTDRTGLIKILKENQQPEK